MTSHLVSSHVVQRSTVQNQFAALGRDADRLRNDTEEISRERSVTVQQLEDLKTEHRSLALAAQSDQEILGGFHAKRDICEKERTRVHRQLEQDRDELKQWDCQANQCLKEEKTRKEAYCKVMSELSEKQEDLLRQFEFARLKAMVSAETVDVLVARATSHPEDAGDVANAAALLKEVTAEYNQEVASNAALLQQLDVFRKQALKSGNGLTEKDLLDMEDQWKGDGGGGGGGSHHEKVPEHMDLFYGGEQGENAMGDGAEEYGAFPTDNGRHYTESGQHHQDASMYTGENSVPESYGGTDMMNTGEQSGHNTLMEH